MENDDDLNRDFNLSEDEGLVSRDEAKEEENLPCIFMVHK